MTLLNLDFHKKTPPNTTRVKRRGRNREEAKELQAMGDKENQAIKFHGIRDLIGLEDNPTKTLLPTVILPISSPMSSL